MRVSSGLLAWLFLVVCFYCSPLNTFASAAPVSLGSGFTLGRGLGSASFSPACPNGRNLLLRVVVCNYRVSVDDFLPYLAPGAACTTGCMCYLARASRWCGCEVSLVTKIARTASLKKFSF